mgnify:CR=1 FL=1
MAGRATAAKAAAAYEAFREPLQAALACLTRATLSGRSPFPLEREHPLELSEVPTPLGRDRGLFLRFAYRYRLAAVTDEDRSEGRTTGYSYWLLDRHGHELLLYQWVPDGPSPVRTPHLHVRALAHPVVSFVLWVLVLYVWHIPALYEASTFDSELLHALEHATFFLAGLGIWLSLFGPLPKPEWFGNGAKVIYVIAVRLAGTVLANVLMWSGSVLYPRYEPTQLERGIEPLSDQGTAGTVMMFESTVLTLGTLTFLFFQWARQDIERQELLDLADREGVALDPARAKRAVAAGQGERLRERILGGVEVHR